MRTYHYVVLLVLLSACEFSGGAMPINAKNLLDSMEGPKVPTVQDEQIEAAQKAEKQGNFLQSAQIYEQMLDKKPDDTNLLQSLADSQRRAGQFDKSISIYDHLIQKDPTNLAAKEAKGLAILSKGDFDTPTPIFEEVLKADPKRWKTLNALGILFVTRGLYPEAQQYFQEASKQHPSSPTIMNNLGLSFALGKNYNSSIDTLNQAVAQTSPESLDRKRVDLNLALVYASSGNLEDARKIAERYLTGASLNNNLGLYAHLAKDDQLAKSYLNMALTESKTYYGKAWDNLESINGSSTDRISTKSSSSSAKPAQQKTVDVIAEPTQTSSAVKSLGKIKVKNLDE